MRAEAGDMQVGGSVPEPDTQRGAQLALLLIHVGKWVNRRVETVRFTDDGLARRYVSLDTSLDGAWPALNPRSYGPDQSDEALFRTKLVPLALLLKAPLGMLDVADEFGSTMPVLSTSENGYLAYSALASYASQILDGETSGSLPQELLQILYRIARYPSAEATEALEELRRSDSPFCRKLVGDVVFMKLATDLSANFVLLVEIRFDAEEQVRRVIKFSYTIAPDNPIRRSPGEWFRSPHERNYVFELPSLGDADSHHFQLSPPVGITVTRCSLTTTKPFSRTVITRPGILVGGTAHLHSSRAGSGASGSASVWLAASVHTIAPATLTSAVILLVSLVLLGARLCLGFPEPGSDTGWQGVLIALPGLAAGFLANQGELGVQSRLLAETRFLLALDAVALIGVAFGAALGLSQDLYTWILSSFVVVSALCFARLGQTLWMAHRAGEGTAS